jgi:AraC-like DNA-binding protein
MPEPGPGRLERSCGFSAGDYIRVAPWRPGLERIEGFFAGHAYDPHRHDTYAIGYTLAGVQSFNYRGARAHSSSGETMILHPDETHDGRSGSDNAFRYRMIYVEPSLVLAALGGRMQALPFAREVVQRDVRLLAALRSVLDDLDAGIDDLQADSFLAQLADILCTRDRSAAKPRHGAPAMRAVRRAAEFLDEAGGQPVASAELEQVSGLDRFALARQFRAMLGTSPYRYLTMRRLDNARRMIRSGVGLADAALDAGFADQSHMTRQFKRAYGLPPGSWRDLLAQGGRER